jgi:hypothetical protein
VFSNYTDPLPKMLLTGKPRWKRQLPASTVIQKRPNDLRGQSRDFHARVRSHKINSRLFDRYDWEEFRDAKEGTRIERELIDEYQPLDNMRHTLRPRYTSTDAVIAAQQHVASRRFHAYAMVGSRVYWINRLHFTEARAYQAALQLIGSL